MDDYLKTEASNIKGEILLLLNRTRDYTVSLLTPLDLNRFTILVKSFSSGTKFIFHAT